MYIFGAGTRLMQCWTKFYFFTIFFGGVGGREGKVTAPIVQPLGGSRGMKEIEKRSFTRVPSLRESTAVTLQQTTVMGRNKPGKAFRTKFFRVSVSEHIHVCTPTHFRSTKP